MRRIIVLVGVVVALSLLWGPLTNHGGLPGAPKITRWGFPGAVTVITNVPTLDDAGDVTLTRLVHISWPGMAFSVVSTIAVCLLAVRFGPKRPVAPASHD